VTKKRAAPKKGRKAKKASKAKRRLSRR
jgi:hypothetical protein